jgi:hypothetical protein
VAVWFPTISGSTAALWAAVLVAIAAALPALRVRWRPLSGLVALQVSSPLRPGDRAWFIRSDEAELVLVTARHRLRMTIALAADSPEEGISVRRTRVLLVPEDL